MMTCLNTSGYLPSLSLYDVTTLSEDVDGLAASHAFHVQVCEVALEKRPKVFANMRRRGVQGGIDPLFQLEVANGLVHRELCHRW